MMTDSSFIRQLAVGDTYSEICGISFANGQVIQLQASNGLYLTLQQAYGLNMVTASGQQSDSNTQFTIQDVQSYLNGDKGIIVNCRLYSSAVGQYLSRFDVMNVGYGYLAACKSTADQYTSLTFTFLLSFASPQVATVLIQADSGLLYGLNAASGINYIRTAETMTNDCLYTFSNVSYPTQYQEVEVIKSCA